MPCTTVARSLRAYTEQAKPVSSHMLLPRAARGTMVASRLLQLTILYDTHDTQHH